MWDLWSVLLHTEQNGAFATKATVAASPSVCRLLPMSKSKYTVRAIKLLTELPFNSIRLVSNYVITTSCTMCSLAKGLLMKAVPYPGNMLAALFISL